MNTDDPGYNAFDDNEQQQQATSTTDPNRLKTIQGYYSQYLGRTPDQSDSGLMGWVNGSMALPDVENAIKGSPEAAQWSTQQAAPAAAGTAAAPTAAYLQSLLGSSQYANNPQAAIDAFNQQTGRTTGNQAVYYDPSQHGGVATIGLPDSYLSLNGGQWGVTQRTPESSSSAAGSSTSDPQTQALIQLLTQQQTSASAQQAADQAKADDLYNTLKTRASQSLTVDPNDPTIAAQTGAYNATQDRASRNYLADLAEQSGPLANTQGQQRIVAEQTGQNEGAFQAQLLGQQLTARRQDISDALNGMRGLLSADQQNDLQAQLSSLDDAIKQQQLAQQQNQFGQTLGYQYAQLGQQNTQFGQNLGLQYSGQDNQLLQLLLSGLATS